MSFLSIVIVFLPEAAEGFSASYVLIENPLVVSAALTATGTAAATIVAAITNDVAAEINFFICNNSFL